MAAREKAGMDEDKQKVLVIVPAYNEADRIAAVIQEASRYLPVLVVDDGSSDDTSLVAVQSGAELLRQEPNQGKGAALRAGFSFALERRYDAGLTLDADGQHDPAEIPDFVQAFQQRRADLIIGARDFRLMPLVRRMTNTFGRWSFSWAVGQLVQDNQSGYRLLSTSMMRAMLPSRERGFEFEAEMIAECIQRGFILEWIPIHTIYRDERSHIHPLQHTANYLRIVFQTRRRMRSKIRHNI
jgi:glycosyltransferase involved in cell wall biosynthesis